METNKALSADQLNNLKATVRQRFDDLYHRIGTSRQKLATTVLLVDQAINKELTKEKIDTAHEKDILNKVRQIEREANNQLPHVPKNVVHPTPVVKTPPAPKVMTPLAPKVKAPVVKTPPAKATAPKGKKETKPKPKPKKK